ncbi:hypothetical protein KC19_8G133300 [Ceratodon purpureus]|uniref:Uncharacterized protein n=1 Tax=Ceratodon purpureus TaxID=3225 RepID=A0A8T0H301_CERPU|nr:hypothetical protein KC19_8G133300 [Ceratodon purpureus]
MQLDYLCCGRVLLVLFVYDGVVLLQAGAVQPRDIGFDIAREFLLFELLPRLELRIRLQQLLSGCKRKVRLVVERVTGVGF